MKKGIKLYSDVGKIESILVHRPGKEILNLSPDLLNRLLWDHFPDLPIAQKNHYIFTGQLRANGVEVHYIEKLLSEVLENDENLKSKFIDEFIHDAKIKVSKIIKKLKKYYLSLNSLEMVNKMIEGIECYEFDLSKDECNDKYFVIDPIPNILYQRDPMYAIYDGVALFHMGSETRQRETLLTKYVFQYHPLFKDNVKFWYKRENETTIEGGDIMVLNENVIMIGVSERTEMKSVEILFQNLTQNLKNEKFKMIVFELPKHRLFMHLTGVLVQADRDTFIVFDPLFDNLDKFKVYEWTMDGKKKHIDLTKINLKDYISELINMKVKFISCGGTSPVNSAREQATLGANVLVLEPGVVFSYDCNRETNKSLRKEGIKVIEISACELKLGGGGASCMTMPLRRID